MGGSTGTNLWGAFGVIAEMVQQGRSGSVVTLLADDGDRYLDTYFDDAWVESKGFDLLPPTLTVERFLADGTWRE